MLKNLSVDNYALINSLSISFGNGLSTITGETGAGKSILLGALGLILGQRADSQVLSDKSRKCVVEGLFFISEYNLQPFFEQNDLDYDPQLIMRREISPQGKSRAFINDTPVTLNQMKTLGERLMDIHSQHSTLELGSRNFQVSVVDVVAGTGEELHEYRRCFYLFQADKRRLEELKELNARQKADEDYLIYLLNEFDQAKIIDGEQHNLEAENEVLQHAESIKADIYQVYYPLSQSETAILPELKRMLFLLQKNGKLHSGIERVSERFQSLLIELQDISQELESIDESIEANPSRMAYIEERLDVIYRLQSKHRLQTDTELIALREELQQRLQGISSMESDIEELAGQNLETERTLYQLAGQLSSKRSLVFPSLEKKLTLLLQQMGMPHAQFRISQQKQDRLKEDGIDELVFLFNANKGGELQEMSKVASGGEVSRIMLGLKSLISGSTRLPSLIFDEIDTGVSGEVAVKLASILVSLSNDMQLIVITHNPQVAARGKFHYKVFKNDSGSVSQTEIRLLPEDERAGEIARMLGGENYSTAALQTARELIGGQL
jgi:DNA repair protein RecN (Recombination protein N)